MALILAIEPDRRQAAQLTSLIRARVGADLVLAETAEQALHAIGSRVPDLVLVPALLAPQDDATLAGALRIIAAAARIQMLTIPVLAPISRKKQPSGVLAKWRRLRTGPAASGGCDPEVFGDQIAAYLAEAAAERAGSDLDRAAASHGHVSVDTPPLHLSVRAPVDDTAADSAIASAMAAVTAVVRDPPGEEPSVDELPAEPAVDELSGEPAVETMAIAETPPAPAPDDAEPGVLLSFVTASDLEGVVTEARPTVEVSLAEELPSVEARVDVAQAPAGGFAAVEAAAEDLPLAGDAISLSTTEDAWDTEDQTEFFLSAFQGAETSVEEPAVYELKADDLSIDALSMDALSFEEQPAESDAPQDESAAPEDSPSNIDHGTLSASSVPLELWMPLSFGTQRRWPELEGMVAEKLPAIGPVIVEPPVTVEMKGAEAAIAEIQAGELPVHRPTPEALPDDAGATEEAARAAAPPASKPEWLELIESLRRDVERLRGEHTPPSSPATARIRETPRPAAPPVASIALVAEPLPSPRTPSIVDILTRARKRAGPAKPVQDEWGFFDPEQCGFAALLAKLDEITHLNDGA